jgi:hypothetical protein
MGPDSRTLAGSTGAYAWGVPVTHCVVARTAVLLGWRHRNGLRYRSGLLDALLVLLDALGR